MRVLLATLALCGSMLAQAAAGGAQAPPPFFTHVGTNVTANGTFNGNTTSWTVGGAGCAVYDGTVTATADGTGSLKATNCAPTSTAVTILTQNESIAGGHEAFRLSFKVKSDATTPVVTFSTNILDNTHGSVIPNEVQTFPADFMAVGASSDFVQMQLIVLTPASLHSGDTWQFQLKVASQAGNIWIDEVRAEPVWFPIRTFLKYPNWRYLWTDKTPPSRICNSTSVQGQICGVSEIDPIPGTTLAQSTLTVKMSSVAGCGSGVMSTQTFAAPTATKHWQITPAQYGAVVAGTKYYVCTQLTVTSGGAVQGTYSDWGVVPEPSSFRAGLMNWISEDGSWYHNQVQQFAFGAYDRWGSLRYGTTNTFRTTADCNAYVSAPADAADCYKRGVRGFSVTALPKATPSGKTPAGSVMADYSANHYNVVMSINPASGMNPTPGASDNFTHYMTALRDFGVSHLQILNADWGYMFSETNVQTQPNGGTTPALTAIAGNIDTSVNGWLHVELSGVAYANPTGSVGTGALITESIPTTAGSSHASAAACGTACAIQVTTPSCNLGRVWGYRMYLAQNNSGVAPANGSFDRVYPTYTGKLLDSDILPCSTTVTIGTGTPGLPHSGIAPLAAEVVSANRAGFIGASTDKAGWKAYTDVMPTHVGGAGVYLADEPALTAFPSIWYAHNYLSGVANGELSYCVLQFASGMSMLRDGCDIVDDDPYGYSLGAGPDEREFGPSARSCTAYDSTANHQASLANCFPLRVDVWTEYVASSTYGSRPCWQVVQLFNRGSFNSYPYAEVWRQYVKAIVGCQNWGSQGAGVLGWGRVSSSGMEDAYYTQLNTNAWTDELNANAAISKYFPVLLQPVKDSTHLGKGQVVSSVSNTGAIGTVCTNAVGSGGYQNATNFPDGPIRFVTHQDATTGDQYIFATNLCDGATTVTFNLANLPGGQTKVEVEDETGHRTQLNISGGGFSDSWTSLGAYVYVVRNPRKTLYTGATARTGKTQ